MVSSVTAGAGRMVLVDDRDALAGVEREMAVEAARARVRHAVAVAWLRSADRDLAGLQRVTWGGPVDAWHEASAAVTDAAEAVAAYEAFGAVD
jgi:hypothetical protein